MIIKINKEFVSNKMIIFLKGIKLVVAQKSIIIDISIDENL
jgi:hypothetical protein